MKFLKNLVKTCMPVRDTMSGGGAVSGRVAVVKTGFGDMLATHAFRRSFIAAKE